jgi:hypothetical protein
VAPITLPPKSSQWVSFLALVENHLTWLFSKYSLNKYLQVASHIPGNGEVTVNREKYICIVSGIIYNLEINSNLQVDVHRFYANTTPFYRRNLNTCRLWYIQEVLEPISCRYRAGCNFSAYKQRALCPPPFTATHPTPIQWVSTSYVSSLTLGDWRVPTLTSAEWLSPFNWHPLQQSIRAAKSLYWNGLFPWSSLSLDYKFLEGRCTPCFYLYLSASVTHGQREALQCLQSPSSLLIQKELPSLRRINTDGFKLVMKAQVLKPFGNIPEHQWLTPVILDTWEVERIVLWGQAGQIVLEASSPKQPEQNRLERQHGFAYNKCNF